MLGLPWFGTVGSAYVCLSLQCCQHTTSNSPRCTTPSPALVLPGHNHQNYWNGYWNWDCTGEWVAARLAGGCPTNSLVVHAHLQGRTRMP